MAFGFGKKWQKRVTGVSKLQGRVSRRIGVPLSGRKSCSRRIFSFLFFVAFAAILARLLWA